MSLPPSTQTSFAFDVPQPALVFSTNAIPNVDYSRVPNNSLNRIITQLYVVAIRSETTFPGYPNLVHWRLECILGDGADSAAVKFDAFLPIPPAPHPYGQLVGFTVNHRLHGSLSIRIIKKIYIPLSASRPLTMLQMLQLITHGPMGRYIYPSSHSGCTVWAIAFVRLLATAGFIA
ncbi:hypothetical protein CPB85DRAFT_1436560 [Mucidula mucida]|nr:hypothetical protein CPB85DRAFT_1436560 [Mucidula mucida]